jgi:acyl carrier protein
VPETLDWTHFSACVSEFLGIESSTLERSTHIYDQLGIDSLGMFSLGMHLTKTFAITLPLALVATISTLGDLFDAMVGQGKPAAGL